MNPIPVPGEPMLVLEPTGHRVSRRPRARTLVMTDLHLGLEAALHRAGMHLPSQTGPKIERIIKVIENRDTGRIVLLGDIKHTIGGSSKQEKREIPDFFERLGGVCDRIDVVLGNHDGGLEELLPSEVNIHRHLVIDDVGLTHGHSWPPDEVLDVRHVLLGHNHPTVMFRDELGQRSFHPTWVRGRLYPSRAGDRYSSVRKRPRCIVMPALDDLGRGTPFNLVGVRPLGPVLSNGLMDLEKGEVHLLDGTFLGTLADIEVRDPQLLAEHRETPTSGPIIDQGWKGGPDGDMGDPEEGNGT